MINTSSEEELNKEYIDKPWFKGRENKCPDLIQGGLKFYDKIFLIQIKAHCSFCQCERAHFLQGRYDALESTDMRVVYYRCSKCGCESFYERFPEYHPNHIYQWRWKCEDVIEEYEEVEEHEKENKNN